MKTKRLILLDLSNKISEIDHRQSNSNIVKLIDKIVQESCVELYKLSDIKANKQINSKKNGHCC